MQYVCICIIVYIVLFAIRFSEQWKVGYNAKDDDQCKEHKYVAIKIALYFIKNKNIFNILLVEKDI